MGERKRRDEKDRHEFAWNPDYGWQILRRCPNYKKAVEIFLTEAERAGDQVSLNAFKIVSLDEANFPDKPQRTFRRQPMVRRRPITKSRKAHLRDQDMAFNFPNVPTFKRRPYDSGEPWQLYYEVDVSTKHYQRFYTWYGDLLLFPINPSAVLPRLEGLSSLWALYSIKIQDEAQIQDLPLAIKHDKILNLSLTINTSFSRSMIEDDLRWFLKSKLDGNATIKEKPRWSKEQFEGYLNVLDAVYPNGKRTKISHRNVGEQCAPRSVLNKVNRDRAVIDWAKDTLKYVEGKLMPIFDRNERPMRTGKRTY